MSETIQVAEKEPSAPPEWLVRTWQFAGRKQQYEAQETDWRSEYPNLWQLVREAKEAGLIDARSTPEPEPRWPDAVPDVHLIMLKPRTLEILKAATREKPGPKTNATQITVDGKTRYMSDRVRMILDADLQALIDTAEGNLSQIRNNRNKRVRRRMMSELHDIVLLRRADLPRDLYGSICLRLGMALPSDFWRISPERLPKLAQAYSQPLEPGKILVV